MTKVLPVATNISHVVATNFTYRKGDGQVSERQGVIVNDDPDNILLLEVTDGDITPLKGYLDMQRQKQQLYVQIAKLEADFRDANKDLPWKAFKKTGITERKDVKYPL